MLYLTETMLKSTEASKIIFLEQKNKFNKVYKSLCIPQLYSADLNYPDETNKTWIFKRVFLKLG